MGYPRVQTATSMPRTAAPLVLGALLSLAPGFSPAEPVTEHPRIWIREADVTRLQSWKVPTNPVWQDGLKEVLDDAVAMYNSFGTGSDDSQKTNDNGFSPNPHSCEMHAMLFAFASVIETNQAQKDDYAMKARDLLMFVIDQAEQGHASAPFRYNNFATADRIFLAESFPLTVDWIYDYLSASDKAKIRKVFLMWATDCQNSFTTGINAHPYPIGVVNDPILFHLDDNGQDVKRDAIRWSMNNFFLMSARSVGMFGLCFDAEDDIPNPGIGDNAPAGALTGYTVNGGTGEWEYQNTGMIRNSIGAWLYMNDYAQKHDAQGGLSPEGFEYWTAGFGPVAMLRLAIHTAGHEMPERYGEQVLWHDNPFWDRALEAHLHQMSPGAGYLAEQGYLGKVHFPAVVGDSYYIHNGESIKAWGPLGIYDTITGNTDRLRKTRWLVRNLGPGGDEKMLERIRSFIPNARVRDGIFFYMLFDPNEPAAAETDMRQTLSPDFYAPFTDSTGFLFSRTDWSEDAAWFNFYSCYARTDHQMGESNSFEFWRKGQWLTKRWVGYGAQVGNSNYKNCVTIQTENPNTGFGAGQENYVQGSQYGYMGEGDPVILAHSMNEDFTYVLGDATRMYNWRQGWEQNTSTEVTEATRSIMWLKPDHIIIYDRTKTENAGHFKRFWLCLPEDPTISPDGRSATMTALEYDTVTGNAIGPTQQLHITTLLPENGTWVKDFVEPLNEGSQEEIIKMRLMMEAPGAPISARFLNVLQGADLGVPADATEYVASESGDAFEGVSLGDRIIMFPSSVDAPMSATTYTAPPGVTNHMVTGLVPDSGYTVTPAGTRGGGMTVTVTAGGSTMTDSGGVLLWAPGTSAVSDGWLFYGE